MFTQHNMRFACTMSTGVQFIHPASIPCHHRQAWYDGNTLRLIEKHNEVQGTDGTVRIARSFYSDNIHEIYENHDDSRHTSFGAVNTTKCRRSLPQFV